MPARPTGGAPLYPPSSTVPAPINRPPAPASQRFSGEGTVVRFSPIRGVTPKSALDRNIWLPAVLGDLEIDEDALFNDYDTLSAGQFSTAAQGPQSARRQRTGAMDTLTLDFDAPFLVAINQDPDKTRSYLYEILRSKKPVHMLITLRPVADPKPEFDGDITFRQLTRTLRQGERDTRYMTLTWTEHRNAEVKRRQHESKGGKHSRKKGVTLPATVKLKSTDTLDSLSYEFYGSYRYWRNIRDANGIPQRFGEKTPIVSLPGRFVAGAKLKIPKVPQPSSGGAAI